MTPQDTSQSSGDTLAYEIAPTETVSEAVIRAVATASGHEPVPTADTTHTPLEPLYTVIDPDALDKLGDVVGSPLVVEFTYEGYEVTVDSGAVRLTSV